MLGAGVVVERPYLWTFTVDDGNELTQTKSLPGMLRVDCASARGMSGGPVVDLAGELVGVLVGGGGVSSPVEGMSELLARYAPASLERAATPQAPEPPEPDALEPAFGPEGRPSREAAIAPLFARLAAERSLVELEIRGGLEGGRFPAVIVSSSASPSPGKTCSPASLPGFAPDERHHSTFRVPTTLGSWQ
jgi:hypothetical protein